MNRIGIDVGGTFTDIVMVDDVTGKIWSAKVPTTPSDRVVGAMNGFHKILALATETTWNQRDYYRPDTKSCLG